MLTLLLLACSPVPSASADLPPAAQEPAADVAAPIEVMEKSPSEMKVAGPSPREAYGQRREELESARVALAARHAEGEDVLEEAGQLAVQALAEQLFPAWYGTPWDFWGTSQAPGEGEIACGYFVSTLLTHAGFRVERVKMAQQASEYIILSLTPASEVQRFHGVDVQRVIEATQAGGEGLYVVGLDYHVGFLLNQGGEVRFCHSSFLPPGTVVCEPAETAPALPSGYTVLGKLMRPPMTRAWLEGEAISTYKP